MERLVTAIIVFLVWFLGRRLAIEEGAKAAFAGFEYGLKQSGVLLPSDKEVLAAVTRNAAMHKPEEIRQAAEATGTTYRRIIRREALEDCQNVYFPEADRAEWKRTHGSEMPPLAYDQGYLQAIKDVISGATDRGKKFFETNDVAEMMDWLDKSQREFSGEPAFMYLDYKPDGRVLGAELLSQTVAHTFRRADAEQRGTQTS